MHNDNAPESCPDTARDIDDAAIVEQLSRIAAVFDLSYDDLLNAISSKR